MSSITNALFTCMCVIICLFVSMYVERRERLCVCLCGEFQHFIRVCSPVWPTQWITGEGRILSQPCIISRVSTCTATSTENDCTSTKKRSSSTHESKNHVCDRDNEQLQPKRRTKRAGEGGKVYRSRRQWRGLHRAQVLNSLRDADKGDTNTNSGQHGDKASEAVNSEIGVAARGDMPELHPPLGLPQVSATASADSVGCWRSIRNICP